MKETTNEMALVTTPDFGADKTIERFGINVAGNMVWERKA